MRMDRFAMSEAPAEVSPRQKKPFILWVVRFFLIYGIATAIIRVLHALLTESPAEVFRDAMNVLMWTALIYLPVGIAYLVIRLVRKR